MSDCMLLSDRMPAVALGRSEWTLEETRHLGECKSCRREWELVQLTGRLGEGIDFHHDHASTTAAVFQRLQQDRDGVHSRPRVWTLVGLAVAAGIAVAVWVGGPDTRPEPLPETGSVVAGRLEIPLHELEILQAAELDSVLRTMDEPAVEGSTVAAPGLADLDSDELQRVLDSWEG